MVHRTVGKAPKMETGVSWTYRMGRAGASGSIKAVWGAVGDIEHREMTY